MGKEVCCHHGDHDAGVISCLSESFDESLTPTLIASKRNEVAIVEGDTPRAKLTEVGDGHYRIKRRSCGVTEGVAYLPPNCP
jgi:hypothetical protein